MEGSDQSWLRRFRSSSFSSDLELVSNPNSCEIDDNQKNYVPRKFTQNKSSERSLAISFKCSGNIQATSDDIQRSLTVGHEMLRQEPEKFPFQCLTSDNKIKIFSLLSICERGVAAQVCCEWSNLVKTPTLWSRIDLIAFPPYPVAEPVDENEESLLVYVAYRKRVKKYVTYLVTIRPVVKYLRLAFDIGDIKDGWLEVLQALLRAVQCQQLKFAELIWNETQMKPYLPDNCSVTWCTNDYKDLMYRHRHRQRLFVKFFDFFSAVASSLTILVIPFDWTDRSLRALNRLVNLEELNLQKYFVFQSLEQQMLDSLFNYTPFLRRLSMEVWTPSGCGLQLFHIKSETLEYLDVSQCRGFYLQEVDLPQLSFFKVSICPMNGPLVSSEGFDITCVHDMLRKGAPNLQQLNNYQLNAEWKEIICNELEAVLNCVCVCIKHKERLD